jgi:hypothetical protein
MILYYTSPRLSLFDQGRLITCPQGVCVMAGHGESHLCFTTEPLQGQGRYVHSIDVPEASALPYEYKNELRQERTRFFALPAPLLASLEIKCEDFEAVTGRKWNTWMIPVLDRRNVRGNPKLKGKWSLIWSSRQGVASAKVGRRLDNTFLSVEVTASADFDPEKDYIVQEKHEEFEKSFGSTNQVKETWQFQMVAGASPQWAIFPSAWKAWVWNDRVVKSAVNFLIEQAPQLRDDIMYASHKNNKENTTRAWRRVAEEIGPLVSARFGAAIDLGDLRGHSWTAVAAMPLRIASRLSENLPYDGWTPPLPRPDFADPERSGRYLLANLYGVYPTKGPGVDHRPQDRPYTGNEGELDNKPDDDFRAGRTLAAVPLAGTRACGEKYARLD